MTDESQKYKSPGLVGWCRHHHVNIRGLVFRKMTEEIWKDVPGYEGEYLVSNYARFLRVHDGKMLHPSKNHANYDVISFRRKQFRVARIVCTAFNQVLRCVLVGISITILLLLCENGYAPNVAQYTIEICLPLTTSRDSLSET